MVELELEAELESQSQSSTQSSAASCWQSELYMFSRAQSDLQRTADNLLHHAAPCRC